MKHPFSTSLLPFLSSFFSLLKTTDASCVVRPPDKNEVCLGFWETKPSCPADYERIKYGSCGCKWGFCTKSYYKCKGIPKCCDGWSGGSSCNKPICTNGCNSGVCISPKSCDCPDGYSGSSCEIAPLPSVEKLTVLTLNFACRDVAPFSACDNCQTRFKLLAAAFANESSVEGLPDLDSVDVILAQELGTDKNNFAQISSALQDRGFKYNTGDPSPTPSDIICDDPLLFDIDDKQIGSALSGLESGGLVTWSRYPIIDTHAQNWCAHSLPVPAGYLLTLLDVAGRAITVINLHAMAEFDFGLEDSAEDVRTYQFGELSGLAKTVSDSFHGDKIPFSVVLGGDFNEDAYSRESQAPDPNCGLISSTLVERKFSSVGLDIHDACGSNVIGEATWDTTKNDLADRFSDGSAHQVLDYLIQYSSSHSGESPKNIVGVLKSKVAWNGKFCEDTFSGHTFTDTAYALSDHNTVTATFQLPQGEANSNVNAALAAFNNAIDSWTNGKLADNAACGQEDSLCFDDSDCCSKDYSWTFEGQHCDGIYCKPCNELGGPCGTQIKGSECCGYYDYSSGLGAHCELFFSGGPKCIQKFDSGASCLFNEECQSLRCNWFRCD
uniref:EGF-like domain-containing protein n=2 Tax=Ditylum brightwellii TaxID=49249 RepID=A0A7S4RC95_9STRA